MFCKHYLASKSNICETLEYQLQTQKISSLYFCFFSHSTKVLFYSTKAIIVLKNSYDSQLDLYWPQSMYGSSKPTFTFMSQLLTVGLGTFIIKSLFIATVPQPSSPHFSHYQLLTIKQDQIALIISNACSSNFLPTYQPYS